MSWTRSSTTQILPSDPASEVVAEAMTEILLGARVEVLYAPEGTPTESLPDDAKFASAAGDGPDGWRMTLRVQLGPRLLTLAGPDGSLLREMLDRLPPAGLRTAAEFRAIAESMAETGAGMPALMRAIRDTLASEVLADLLAARFDRPVRPGLIDETLDYLIELTGTRVESNDLTHGVVITDGITDEPRLRFAYPSDVRAAKRAPLLFDGHRSVLVVDPLGRARTELQRHHLDEFDGPGSLPAEATRRLGGLAMLLESDRTIRVYIDGQPLLVRRGEHWTSFPLELGSAIGRMIDGSSAAQLVVQTALAISAGRHGAILAVVPNADRLEGIVPLKDRYDLRNDVDREAMRIETRLHHLIDADPLDSPTLTRLAALDGATIIDRDSNLLAYGAVVASNDSQNEGARTAAAKTLSQHAEVVLKVSADGDISIFRDGALVTTLLGSLLTMPRL